MLATHDEQQRHSKEQQMERITCRILIHDAHAGVLRASEFPAQIPSAFLNPPQPTEIKRAVDELLRPATLEAFASSTSWACVGCLGEGKQAVGTSGHRALELGGDVVLHEWNELWFPFCSADEKGCAGKAEEMVCGVIRDSERAKEGAKWCVGCGGEVVDGGQCCETYCAPPTPMLREPPTGKMRKSSGKKGRSPGPAAAIAKLAGKEQHKHQQRLAPGLAC